MTVLVGEQTGNALNISSSHYLCLKRRSGCGVVFETVQNFHMSDQFPSVYTVGDAPTKETVHLVVQVLAM